MLRNGARLRVSCDEVFPAGCYLVPGSIGEVEDFDEKTGKRSPSVDKVTGKRVFQVRVSDADPELRTRTRETSVKVLTDRQPVAPTGVPFEPVEFDGMTVTPYVTNTGRLAYSLRATGMRAPATVAEVRASGAKQQAAH